VEKLYLLLTIILFSACPNTSKNNQMYNSPDPVIFSSNDDHNNTNNTPHLSNITPGVPDNIDILPTVNKKLYLRIENRIDFDLSTITELIELEELYISVKNIDITPLASLVNLRKLELGHITRYDNIFPFSELINLRELHIVNDDVNSTFSELLPLQQLELLRILEGGYPVELDISNIVQLHTLKELRISSARNDFHIKNYYGLQNLINLEVLDIQHSGNFDLSFISSLQNLHTLGIRHSIINDVSPLLDLPYLTEIDLYNSKIRDFSPLLKHPLIKRITGFIWGDGYEWSPEYARFWEQGVDFWARTYDR
jgi:hypothetical protein